MFKAPFSFSGRITRTEYLLTCLGLFFVCALAGAFMGIGGVGGAIGAVIFLVSLWIVAAQGWKRAQDAGWYGIISIIPYVNLLLLFISGDQGANAHGPNPRLKAAETMPAATPTVVPPPLPDAWERARSEPAPKPRGISFKCTSCGAQNTNVVHFGTACCQYCDAPKT